MNLLPQLFNGMVVIGSLSMVGDVSVVSDVFDQLFLMQNIIILTAAIPSFWQPFEFSVLIC